MVVNLEVVFSGRIWLIRRRAVRLAARSLIADDGHSGCFSVHPMTDTASY
jgi:hypothetical protein